MAANNNSSSPIVQQTPPNWVKTYRSVDKRLEAETTVVLEEMEKARAKLELEFQQCQGKQGGKNNYLQNPRLLDDSRVTFRTASRIKRMMASPSYTGNIRREPCIMPRTFSTREAEHVRFEPEPRGYFSSPEKEKQADESEFGLNSLSAPSPANPDAMVRGEMMMEEGSAVLAMEMNDQESPSGSFCASDIIAASTPDSKSLKKNRSCIMLPGCSSQ